MNWYVPRIEISRNILKYNMIARGKDTRMKEDFGLIIRIKLKQTSQKSISILRTWLNSPFIPNSLVTSDSIGIICGSSNMINKSTNWFP